MRAIYRYERTVRPDGKVVNRPVAVTYQVPQSREERDRTIIECSRNKVPDKVLATHFGLSVMQIWRILHGTRSGRNHPTRRKATWFQKKSIRGLRTG